MSRKDYIALATALSRGYAQLHSPAERRGFDSAIASVSQVCASTYPNFDPVRFSATIYQVKPPLPPPLRPHYFKSLDEDKIP